MSDVLNMIEELAAERRQVKKEAYEREQASKLAANKATYDAMMVYFRPVLHAAREALNNLYLRKHIDARDVFSTTRVDVHVVIVDDRTVPRRELYWFTPSDGEIVLTHCVGARETATRMSVKDALTRMIDLLAQILSTYKGV